MAHDFPGNVRELENVLEYASVVCKNSIVGPEHLPGYLVSTDAAGTDQADGAMDRDSSWEEIEKDFVLAALRKNRWKKAATAHELGIHPTTLWRKMKRLRIKAEVP